jgi:hypothetical protein
LEVLVDVLMGVLAIHNLHMEPGSLRNLIRIIHGGMDRDAPRSPLVSGTGTQDEALEIVGGDFILIQQNLVVAWPGWI